MAIPDLIKVFTDFGTGVLFLSLYLVTIYAYRKEIKENQNKSEARTERVIVTLDKASQAMDAMVFAANEVKQAQAAAARELREFNDRRIGELKTSVDDARKTIELFISLQNGRDERGR